jgi:RNA polymerase sigma-70 factor (ECF subfamily)
MGAEASDDLETTRQIVRAVLARRRWGLIEPAAEADFAAEVDRKARAWQAASALPWAALVERAVINAYCERWYAACRSADAARQARAWTELYQHVYAVARELGGAAEASDRAQEILERIATRLEQVRDPSSFLSWVNQVARRWMIQSHRQADAALAALDEEGMAAQSLAAGTEDQAERLRVEALIRRCLRSPAQQQVIIGRILDQRSVQQVAEALGKTPGHVRTLTHRALARLRGSAELLEALGAWQARRGAAPARDDDDEAEDPARWLREAAAGAYLGCREAQARLPGYVEAALRGLDPARLDSALARHLAGCEACRSEQAALLALAERATTAAEQPGVAPELWFLPYPTLAGFVRRLAGRLARQARPALAEALAVELEPFLARQRAAGSEPIRTMSEAERVLASTYAATAAVAAWAAARPAEVTAGPEGMAQAVQQQAVAAARGMGMARRAARAFAAQYAAAAGTDVRMLARLVGG